MKLEGFLKIIPDEKTPRGSISTIGISKEISKKISTSVYHVRGTLITFPCGLHGEDTPTLLMLVKYTKDRAPVKRHVCVLCWNWSRGASKTSDVPLGEVMRHQPGPKERFITLWVRMQTSAMFVALPTKKNRTTEKAVFVQPCYIHPKVTVPVDLMTFREPRDGHGQWMKVATSQCCPLCWEIITRKDLEKLAPHSEAFKLAGRSLSVDFSHDA